MWPVLTGSLIPELRRNPHRVYVDDDQAVATLSLALATHLGQVKNHHKSPVIICVGTDRSTGDSLGPLTGSALHEKLSGWQIPIYGTLDEPVHAANLIQVLEMVTDKHPDQTVLAIDACLGRSENVGYITVKPGPLKPGTGVNKKLPPVGDLHLVGVVNVGGFMEYFVLQNTRLSLVVRMATTIASAITQCLTNHCAPTHQPASAPLNVFS